MQRLQKTLRAAEDAKKARQLRFDCKIFNVETPGRKTYEAGDFASPASYANEPSCYRRTGDQFMPRSTRMWQALYFLPDPHGHGSLRPIFLPVFRSGSCLTSPLLAAIAASCWARTPLPAARRRPRPRAPWPALVDGPGSIELPPGAEVGEEIGVELLHAENQVGHLVADPRPHLLEDLHALALVLDLRVHLRVAPQADRRAEVVHRPQVFHPVGIEDLEHEGLFHLAHLGPMLGVEGVDQAIADRRAIGRLQLVGRGFHAEILPGPRREIDQSLRVGRRGGLSFGGDRPVGGLDRPVPALLRSDCRRIAARQARSDRPRSRAGACSSRLRRRRESRTARTPTRPGRRDRIAVATDLAPFGEESAQSHLYGELGLLAGVEGPRAPWTRRIVSALPRPFQSV